MRGGMVSDDNGAARASFTSIQASSEEDWKLISGQFSAFAGQCKAVMESRNP